MEDEKLVDLPPHEWQSEREKPYEPFWGDGLPEAIASLVGLTITMTVIYLLR